MSADWTAPQQHAALQRSSPAPRGHTIMTDLLMAGSLLFSVAFFIAWYIYLGGK